MATANALNNLAKAAVGLGAGASLFQASVYNVDGGYRAVMFDRLRGVQVRPAGLHATSSRLAGLASRRILQGHIPTPPAACALPRAFSRSAT